MPSAFLSTSFAHSLSFKTGFIYRNVQIKYEVKIPANISPYLCGYRNEFQERVLEVIPEDVSLENVQIWFQDETRIGQQGSLSRLWAEKGTRPRVVRQQQFIYQYIYGAVCPEEEIAAAIIAPHNNTATMALHLEEI